MQHKSVWSVAQVSALEEWRSSTKASGEPCAMMNGRFKVLMWYVSSSAVAMQSLVLRVPTLAEALDQYGSIMWRAQGKNLRLRTVHTTVLEKITVGMVKMLELSV